MSATHFSRAFKQSHGVTFQEFLLRYRVQQARQKLQSQTVSIADVAYAVGFSDPSYFTRVFKRFLGVAPSDYSADIDNQGDIALENTDEKMASSSQIVRQLSSSFQT
jgi:AraC-like DNA-binding protein